MIFRHPSFRGRIGVARRDITPLVGIRHKNWGASEHEVAEGTHRPLTATVMTIQRLDGGDPLVLAALDLGWWRSKDDEWFVRGYVLQRLGLTEERLIIALSHTHSGPSTSRSDSDLPGGRFIEPYLLRLRETLVEAVMEATDTATEAILEWGYGICDLAKNRDLPDGHRYTCGFNPNQPADQTLLVGRVWGEGKVKATLVNYACHPTTLAFENRLISPDYVGAMREMVESETQAPALFLQGASGELAPRDQYTGRLEVADRNGRVLGRAVLATLEQMLEPGKSLNYQGVVESGAPLAIWLPTETLASNDLNAKRIEIPLTLKDLESIEEIERKLADETVPAMLERLRRKRLVRLNVGDEPTMALSVNLWRLGGCLLVGIPAEPYSVLQKQLRTALPAHAIVAMNVANGHFGYLPPSHLYEHAVYSVWQTPFAKGSLERVVDTIDGSLRKWSEDRETINI